MSRFQPSVELLETRETPSSFSSVPTPSEDGYYGTGVYKSTDSGKTWTLASDGSSGRITGIAVDPTDAAVPTGTVKFVVDGPQADGAERYFNGIVNRISAGGASETITTGGPQTETEVRPTVLLQRLANPGVADPAGTFRLTFNGQTTV